MNPLFLLLKVVLFLLFLALAAQNTDMVTVRAAPGVAWQAPMVLIVLTAFALGLVAGLMACGLNLLRARRELSALKKRLTASDDT